MLERWFSLGFIVTMFVVNTVYCSILICNLWHSNQALCKVYIDKHKLLRIGLNIGYEFQRYRPSKTEGIWGLKIPVSFVT